MDKNTPRLTSIKMASFGGFSNESLGEFEPGLTIIKGRNEAGKSTTTSFITQVLYGWESARSTKAHYKPGGTGKRSGWLRFVSPDGEWRLARDEDSAKEGKVLTDTGVPWTQAFQELTAGVDKTTYTNVFSFNSDQLKKLEDSGQLTSKLLTAGSATSVSPVRALEAIEKEMELYSRSAKTSTYSIPLQKRKVAELAERKAHIEAALAEEIQQYEELLSLERSSEEAREDRERIAEAQLRIERLATDAQNVITQLAQERARQDELSRQQQEMQGQLGALEVDHDLLAAGDTIVGFASQAQRQSEMINSVDTLTLECEHLQSVIMQKKEQEQNAPEDFPTETPVSASNSRAKMLFGVGAGLFAVGIVAMVAMAAFSLPASASVLSAFVAVSGAIFASIGATLLWSSQNVSTTPEVTPYPQPSLQQDPLEQELIEKQSRITQLQTQCALWESQVREGLATLTAQLPTGRELVARVTYLEVEYKQMREREQNRIKLSQTLEGIISSLTYTEEKVQELEARLRELLGVSSESEANQKIAELTSQTQQLAFENRDKQEEAERLRGLIGERTSTLNRTEKLDELQEIEIELAEAEAILKARAKKYIELKLARDLLRETIAEWEEDKQPDIYTKASELFSSMTQGRWKGIRPGEKEGELLAVRSDLETLPVEHLSTSTTQLLYLALRLALLKNTPDIGPSLPVVIDDAFVHLDDARSEQVARVISEFADSRQVLMFTFKDQTVDLLKSVSDRPVNIVEL